MSEQITNQTPIQGAPSSTLTVKLPRLNWQMTALVLIAVVAAFQTFQLATLKGKATIRPAAAAPTGASNSAPASGAGLQEMVGGC